jgi:hypothetical protein
MKNAVREQWNSQVDKSIITVKLIAPLRTNQIFVSI